MKGKGMTVLLVEIIIFISLITVFVNMAADIGDNGTLENLSGVALTVFGLLGLLMVIGFIIYIKKQSKM